MAIAALFPLPPSRSLLGFRPSCARSQCRPRRRYGRASRLPLHTPDHWNLPKGGTAAPSTIEGDGTIQGVMDFLRDEGISGAGIEQLDLPLSVEVMRERLEFLSSVGVDKHHIARYPVVLTCSVKRNMVPVVDYLDKLGFTSEELPSLLANFPAVLHSSVVVDLKPIVDYLLGYGVAAVDVSKILLRYPDVLGFKREGTMSTSIAYLVSVGINPRQVASMITIFPEVLGMRVGNNVKKKVEFYRDLGFGRDDLARFLEKHPSLLGFELDDAVKPRVRSLLQAGIRKSELPSFIARFPEVLELDLEAKLAEKTIWLTKELLLDPAEVPRVLEKLPQMLVINEQMAMQKIEILKKRGIAARDVAKMVADCPQILAVKLERTLKPNLAFFLREMRKPVSFPAYLTYDLTRRIKPRYRMIQLRRINCTLAWFLDCSDEKFKRRMTIEFMDAPVRPQDHQAGDLEESSDDASQDSEDNEHDTGEVEQTLQRVS